MVCCVCLQGAEAPQSGVSNSCGQQGVHPECCRQEQQDLAEDQGHTQGDPGVLLCATCQVCISTAAVADSANAVNKFGCKSWLAVGCVLE
jgi:hypothetical protein